MKITVLFLVLYLSFADEICLKKFLSSSNACWPGDFCYNESISLDNGRVVSLPKVVVLAKNVSDVVNAMKAAQGCQVGFSVRNGGHGAVGYALVKVRQEEKRFSFFFFFFSDRMELS